PPAPGGCRAGGPVRRPWPSYGAQVIVALHPLDDAVLTEDPVLEDARYVIDAVLVAETGCTARLVVDDDQSAQPFEHLLLGLAVRMRVVPERRRGLIDRPLDRTTRARPDGRVRATVHLRGQVHPVPMEGGGDVEVVDGVDADGLSRVDPHRRSQERAVVPHG